MWSNLKFFLLAGLSSFHLVALFMRGIFNK